MDNKLFELEKSIDSLIDITYNLIGLSDISDAFDLLLNIIMCKLAILDLKKDDKNYIKNPISFMVELEIAKVAINNLQMKMLEYSKDNNHEFVYDALGRLYKYKEGLKKIDKEIK